MMTTPPHTASQPSQGWIMKQQAKKIGMNGMSNRAVGPMPERKPRIWSRSRIGCMLSDCLAPLSGSVVTRSKMRGESSSSNRAPTRASILERIVSREPCRM